MTERKIIKGAVWASLGSWGGSLVSFLVFVVTARLLGPDAFGVVALAWLVLTFPDLFLSKTVAETIIQKEGLTAEHSNSLFWIAVLASLGLVVGVVLLTPLISTFFKSDELQSILPLFGGLLIPIALKAVPFGLMRRALRFKELAFASMISLLVAGFVGVTLAALGFGVWSLVALAFVEYVISLVLVWRAAAWRPTGFIHWPSVREMVPFARNTFAAAFITQVSVQFPRFIIGAYFGVVALGIYMIAWNTLERLSSILMAPVRNVALPAITETRSDVAAFQEAYTRVLTFSAQITYPVYIGAAAIAPIAVPLLFGAQWVQSGILAQIFLFIGLRSGVTELNSAVIKGFDRTDLALALSSINLVINVALVLLAIPFGLVAVAFAVLARRFITWPLSAYFVKKSCGLSVRHQFMAGLPALFAVLVMFAAVVGVGRSLGDTVPDPALLVLMVLVGVFVYGAGSFLIASSTERSAYRQMIKDILSGDLNGFRRYLFS